MTSQKIWKILLKIIITMVIIFILSFVCLFVYYLWQFKYGSPETQQNLSSTYEDKFTVGVDNGTTNPRWVEDPTSLIQAHNPKQGNPEGQVTIIAFIDFQCPYCQEAFPVLKYVTDKYSPVVQLIFKQFPLTTLHPDAYNASLASTCAAEQNQFWPYHDLLLTAPALDEATLYSLAEQLGISQTNFQNCFNAEKYRTNIEQDLLDGVNAGVRGTPTYIVNGNIIEGVLSREMWDTIILKHLNK